jgi:type I restriction enzyme, S subunit
MASEFYITYSIKTYTDAGLAQSKMWQPNTLCMTIAGENTAETAILTFPACFPDSVVGFIADPDKADVRFVKYYFDTIKKQIKRVTKGATQDNLSLDKLLSFQLHTPSLKVQKKIAAILSSYDALLLANSRRTAILDEMVEALYREWFVRFRFPGHENVPLVPSPLGNIPQGWKTTPFTNIAEVLSGGTPKTSRQDYWGGTIPFFTPKDCPNGVYAIRTERTITDDGHNIHHS